MLLLGNHYIKLLAYCPYFSKYIALFCCSCSKVFSGLKQDKSTPKQFCRSAIQTELQGTRAKVETSLHAFKRLQEKARFYVFFTPQKAIYISQFMATSSIFKAHQFSPPHLLWSLPLPNKSLLSLACKVLMLTIPL